ncbi:Septum site-determining protein MinC [Candidatus Kinetoplastibacterium sorsogonicusi]|uniref:Probable septum site-determining protein MinC n=1 Tax=Candidatus Kinetoplastidibacterium kentomonadis TaxID=1576550 RepID=A0A3Q8F6V3_9PROT|nr:septum site-determining protein MinC [Candidatus Kinetoplastibacterium sorsogonicusi]AWD32633.1 Septum site-determining protein MinC [Candidatus Kinetoplastibacterium sorsogonicusi]
MNTTTQYLYSIIDFKGITLYAIKLVIYSNDINLININLRQHISKNPLFFQNESLILDLTNVNDDIDVKELLNVLKQHKLNIIGFNAIGNNYSNLIIYGIPYIDNTYINKNYNKQTSIQEPTLIINKPLRSGQKIYAKNADLVIIGMVSQGAEIIADGHIHVYGPLRGKAIAGANGNVKSCIFTTQLDAELLSISGIYNMLDNKLNKNIYNRPTLTYLYNEKLYIESI